MAQTAGYLGKLKHATTLGGAYTAINGIKASPLNINIEEVDISNLKDNDGWRRFLMALGSGDISAEGDFIDGDTQQDAIFAAATGRTTVFLQVLADGTNGYKGEFYITNFKLTPLLDGASAISFTAKMTGAPTAV